MTLYPQLTALPTCGVLAGYLRGGIWVDSIAAARRITGMSRLRKHFADWLDSEGLKQVKERLRTCATSVLGESIDGVLFTLPRLGTFRAIQCDLTGCVTGCRYDDQQYITAMARYNEDGIKWQLVR